MSEPGALIPRIVAVRLRTEPSPATCTRAHAQTAYTHKPRTRTHTSTCACTHTHSSSSSNSSSTAQRTSSARTHTVCSTTYAQSLPCYQFLFMHPGRTYLIVSSTQVNLYERLVRPNNTEQHWMSTPLRSTQYTFFQVKSCLRLFLLILHRP